jgi:hypothetical protein
MNLLCQGPNLIDMHVCYAAFPCPTLVIRIDCDFYPSRMDCFVPAIPGTYVKKPGVSLFGQGAVVGLI